MQGLAVGGDEILSPLNRTIIMAVSVMAIVVWPIVGIAETEHGDHGEGAEHAEDATHDEHLEGTEHHEGGHHDFNHALGLFLGVTDEPGHDSDQTFGLEYAYKLSKNWAVGGLIDYAGPDQRNWIAAPVVYWKPGLGGLILLAAPGVEFHDGRGEVDHHHLKASDSEIDEDKTEFLFRLGAIYMFHVGSRYGIGPTVNFDLVDGHEVLVYGLTFEVLF